MDLSKLKLGSKLGGGFGIVLLFMAAIGVIGFTQISGMQGNLETLNLRINEVETIYELSKDFDEMARNSRTICLTSDDALNKKFLGQYKTGKDKLIVDLDKLEKLVSSAQGRDLLAKLKGAAGPFFSVSDKVVELGSANRNAEAAQAVTSDLLPVQAKFIGAMDEFVGYVKKITAENMNQATSAATFGRIFITTSEIIAFALGVLLAFLLTKSITKPLNRVIAGLSDASEQVAAASSQVASSSQSLAEGTSEQAASLEETSSSLEEISSMTKQNADNTSQAKALMDEAKKIVGKVDAQMSVMTSAIAEVAKSSEETGKIIKTIDEIAFQTNLLALNAAVEAARAGEAGAGFAVVADEVRNLAMRAAEAAKTTSSLIENTVATVRKSSELTLQTQEAFKENVIISAKIGNLVDEVEAASQEQSKGIGQVTSAVAEMDKVVQASAANAEESASAAEEMNAQAEQMKGYVAELAEVVGGSSSRRVASGYETKAMGESQDKARNTFTAGKKTNRAVKKIAPRSLNIGKARKTNPEEIIPMDNDDFKSF